MSAVADISDETMAVGGARMSRYHVPAVSRAIDVIEVVASSETTLRFSQIARDLDVPRASLFSILATLVDTGMLERDGPAYGLGPRFAQLAGDLGLAPRLARLAYPVLRRLVGRYDQSAQVAVLHEGAAQYVAAVESTQTLRVATWVGNRNALDVTAIGHALVVDWSLEQLRSAIPSANVARLDALAEQLATARELGYTTDDGETETGVLCVGAPIRGGDGFVTAALSISVPEAALTGTAVASLPSAVREAADEISVALRGAALTSASTADTPLTVPPS